jgi:hypothetical protein
MRIPDKILSCVGFMSHDTPQVKYGATGFVVGMAPKSGQGLLFTLWGLVSVEEQS